MDGIPTPAYPGQRDGDKTVFREADVIGKFAATVFAILLLAGQAQAHGPSQSAHQSHRIGDFTLESGEVVKDFAISYVTHGFARLVARVPRPFSRQA